MKGPVFVLPCHAVHQTKTTGPFVTLLQPENSLCAPLWERREPPVAATQLGDVLPKGMGRSKKIS